MNNNIPLDLITPDVTHLRIDQWLSENIVEFNQKLHRSGGVLMRGFGLHAISEFNQLAQIIAPNLLEYTNQSTPRTRIGGKIYSSTEYPKEQSIPLHSENAYTHQWPNVIMFFSVLVAESGGQTPIADNRLVYQRIPEKLRDKFIKNGIMYVRNYHKGIDLSWQTVFQTEDKKVVEDYCQQHNINYHWQANDTLRTEQVCQAILEHPTSKEIVWFNQAHLFHVSNLSAEDQKILLSQFSEQDLPRHSYYGDGSAIDINDLTEIRQAYTAEKRMFDWQKGDVMILDNLLMSHAREPFTGNRKVVVAMG